MKSEAFLNGQLIWIDKPLEWTSFDVVNKLRNGIRQKTGLRKLKVGHAGTLDPLASGLLLVCTGKFTKRIADFTALDKHYTGIIRLGSSTPTYDRESQPDRHYPTEHISRKDIEKATKTFTGVLQQVPPAYSAIKRGGKKAYELARKGDELVLNPREISIHHFEITHQEGLDLHFSVHCSKGTYIRSLAHDFGQFLNSGAHLAALRRTRIGNFSVNIALSPQEYLDHLPGAAQSK